MTVCHNCHNSIHDSYGGLKPEQKLWKVLVKDASCNTINIRNNNFSGLLNFSIKVTILDRLPKIEEYRTYLEYNSRYK